MKFSEELVEAGQPILHKIYQHPFVEGIGNGDLPKEALTFYVGQDYNYLNAFIKVYAAAIQKSQTRADMAIFAKQIDFILHSEIHPHHNFCNVAGVKYETLQHEPQAPGTYLYNEHMYRSARTGDLIDIVAAMTPCPWTYLKIANRFVKQGKNTDDNVFKPWIEFYADMSDDGDSILTQLFDLIDREAEHYDQHHLDVVKEEFLKSCELEWEFWDQAYHQRSWHFIKPMKQYR